MHGSVKKITVVALLGAAAAILMLFEFPIPFLIPSFVKMDFSELPALLGAFAYGPIAGAAVCLIKNLVNLPFSNSGGVGELCNFLLGCAMVVPAGLIYRKNRTRKGALIGSAIGVLAMGVISFPLNLYVTYPIYSRFLPIEKILEMYRALLSFVETLPQCLLIFNVPFTILKGIFATVLAFLVYKPLSRFFKES